jgi:hypothetical protein
MAPQFIQPERRLGNMLLQIVLLFARLTKEQEIRMVQLKLKQMEQQ